MRRNIEFARFWLNFRSFLPLITRDESRDVACRLDRVLLRALEYRRSTGTFRGLLSLGLMRYLPWWGIVLLASHFTGNFRFFFSFFLFFLRLFMYSVGPLTQTGMEYWTSLPGYTQDLWQCLCQNVHSVFLPWFSSNGLIGVVMLGNRVSMSALCESNDWKLQAEKTNVSVNHAVNFFHIQSGIYISSFPLPPTTPSPVQGMYARLSCTSDLSLLFVAK